MNICVYGASSSEIDEAFIKAGEELGGLIARRGHSLVFGAGASGMMGAAARGCHDNGGKILGILPEFFGMGKYIYDKCDKMTITESMRERKQLMEENSDAFVMTPGGIGTYEEFYEILTAKQLMRHNKAIAILNTNGYFEHFNDMMKYMEDMHFVTHNTKNLYKILSTPTEVIEYIENYQEAQYTVSDVKLY